MKKLWRIFSSVFTIVGLAALVLYVVPLPFFEQNSTTLVVRSKKTQMAVAKALSLAIGEPVAELNTTLVERFLFRDGTSIDRLPQSPQFNPVYEVTSLKQVVLSFFSGTSPIEIASRISNSLVRSGFQVQVISQPDPAFPDGAIVLLFSDAFRNEGDAGFGIIVRKHAFRVGGPRPTRFIGWPR